MANTEPSINIFVAKPHATLSIMVPVSFGPFLNATPLSSAILKVVVVSAGTEISVKPELAHK